MQAITLGALGLVAAVDIYEHRDHSNNVSLCHSCYLQTTFVLDIMHCLPASTLRTEPGVLLHTALVPTAARFQQFC